jgi:drug/metabolite transporter (DMT)-like permease
VSEFDPEAMNRRAAEKLGAPRIAGSRGYGILLLALAAVLWSTAGLFVRLLDLDVWTTLAWRSLFAALSMALVIILRRRRAPQTELHGMGFVAFLAVPIAAMSMGSYVVALELTTVANVMIVYATVPFVVAGVAYFWLGEKIKLRFAVATVIAMVGILIMAAHAPRPQDIAGNAVAFLMTLAFAVQLVMARRFPALDMAPVNAMGAGLCALLCWPFAAATIPSFHQLMVLAVFGITTTSLAYTLAMIGGRHIPSAEAGLIGLLEVVLGPLWVWIAFRERPGATALVGGIFVLVPVLWYLSASSRRPGNSLSGPTPSEPNSALNE